MGRQDIVTGTAAERLREGGKVGWISDRNLAFLNLKIPSLNLFDIRRVGRLSSVQVYWSATGTTLLE